MEIRNTKVEVLIPKSQKNSLQTHIFKRFVEGFGTDEAVTAYNTPGQRKIFMDYWKDNVTDKPGGCVSLADYLEWIEEIRKILPKKWRKKDFDREIIAVDFIMGPLTFEAAAEMEEIEGNPDSIEELNKLPEA